MLERRLISQPYQFMVYAPACTKPHRWRAEPLPFSSPRALSQETVIWYGLANIADTQESRKRVDPELKSQTGIERDETFRERVHHEHARQYSPIRHNYACECVAYELLTQAMLCMWRSKPAAAGRLAATVDMLRKHQVRRGAEPGVRHPTPGEWAASKGPQRGPSPRREVLETVWRVSNWVRCGTTYDCCTSGHEWPHF